MNCLFGSCSWEQERDILGFGEPPALHYFQRFPHPWSTTPTHGPLLNLLRSSCLWIHQTQEYILTTHHLLSDLQSHRLKSSYFINTLFTTRTTECQNTIMKSTDSMSHFKILIFIGHTVIQEGIYII